MASSRQDRSPVQKDPANFINSLSIFIYLHSEGGGNTDKWKRKPPEKVRREDDTDHLSLALSTSYTVQLSE